MILPKEAHAYIQNVINRCEDLMEANIWTGLDKLKLRGWLSNFKTEKEKYFVACILDNLIYRTNKQTLALLKHLFRYTLPLLTKKSNFPLGIINEWDIYLNKLNFHLSYADNETIIPDPKIRFVGVIKNNDSLAKSSYYLARLIKKDLSVFEHLIINPKEIQNCISKGVKVFIFIDDFLGTGMQFKGCIENQNLQSSLNLAYFAYVPLVAHKSGIELLNQLFPKIELAYVEYLDETNGIFHKDSKCFDDGENIVEKVKKYYYGLLKTKNINIENQFRKGYGELELLYIFEHASPDNSLPILWWPDTNEFKNLFNR